MGLTHMPSFYEVMIERNFSSAHQLRGYKGKCENLHGHNYKVEIYARGEELNNIGLLIDFVDLKKRTGEFQSLHILMRTNEGARRDVALVAEPRLWSGATMMFRGTGASMRCAMRHAIDYEANVMRVSFPRRCASSPRWVRFRIQVSAAGGGGYFADDALSDSPIGSQDSNDLARSDRVFREAAN